MIYDVAIIGGGIAGLALSIDLSSRGYKVVVIEKGDYPRHKVCGEYISVESKAYLKKLCPALNDFTLPDINIFQLTSVGQKQFTTVLPLGGFGISRYLLEDLLFKRSKELGSIFFLNTKAIETKVENEKYCITTNNLSVTAKLVCNSSGRKSNLEIKENKSPGHGTNYIGVKYHIKFQRDPHVIGIHNFPGGYCGISNIEEDKSCLCYLVNAAFLKEANNSIPELENKILYKNAHLKKIFTEAEFLFKEPMTISGINFRIKKPVNDSTFFLGDSAGSISPITGNGMSIGLRSASILANQIDRYFLKLNSKHDLVEQYNNFWNKEFSTRIKLSRHFQKLAEYPSLTNLTIAAFNAFPFLAKGVIKQTHGKPF